MTAQPTAKGNFAVYKEKLNKFIHEDNQVAKLLGLVEEKTKVPRINLALGFIGFLALYLIVGYGAQFLCNFIGFLYPAYASIKAIESDQKDDDTQWLIYWVVYSAFATVEFFGDIFLFWIPFYWLFKCLLMVWFMAPITNNGSVLLYNKVIRPFVLKHQTKIDAKLAQGSALAQDAAGQAEKFAADAAINEFSRKLD